MAPMAGAATSRRAEPQAEYRAKGSHLIQAAKWVDERLGEGTFRSLAEDKGVQAVGILLPGTWYSVEPLVDMLEDVAAHVGRSVQDITCEIARQNALEDLTTMYRVFLRIAAPQRVMGFTPNLWRTYVAFGDASAIENEPGNYLGECTGIPDHLIAWSCGAWLGFVPTAIELAGGKNPSGTIERVWADGSGTRRLHCRVRYQVK